MHQVYAPQQLKQRVLAAADCERAARTTAAPVRWKKAALRASAVCCAFALVVGGIAIVGSRHSVVSPAGNSAVNGAAAAKPQNSFDLAVYAAGETNSQRKTATVNLNAFGWNYSGGNDFDVDANNHPIPSTLRWLQTYQLDMTCTGTNLKKMKYTLDTSALKGLEKIEFDTITASKNPAYKDGITEKEDRSLSFKIEYTQQKAEKKTVQRNINIQIPYTLKEHDIIMHSEKYGVSKYKEVADNLSYRTGQTLAKAKLTLEATFNDGTVEKKTYRIAPIPVKEYMARRHQDDANQIVIAKLPEKGSKTEAAAKASYEYCASHALFTITQVDN